MTTKKTAWTFIGGLTGTFLALSIWAFQARTITLVWDAMPAGEVWTQVRAYEKNLDGTTTLIATAPCTIGTPNVCPTSVSFSVTKMTHTYIVRSFDGAWESDDSNTAFLPGPPKPPGNLRKQ